MPDQSQTTRPRIGHFQVVRELGRGGMGIVYKAQDLSLHRMVALKVLPKHLAHDAAFVKRFLREARAGARLVHPNIAAVHAVGEQDGTYYIAMEYVKGENLSQLIKRLGQLSVTYAIDIIRQSADALAEAHRAGIVHRDVKPQNIMVDQAGRVRVMDFGLARLLQADSKLTADGAQIGTPRYMSPEQCRGNDVDTRSDIFSLGIVFFELLAGRAPYDGDSPLALMYQIVQEKQPSIREFNRGVPPSVVKLIERMTHKDPAKRFPSAEALISELQSLKLRTSPSPQQRAQKKAKAIATTANTAARKIVQRAPWNRIRLVAGGIAAFIAIAYAALLALTPEPELLDDNALDHSWRVVGFPDAIDEWNISDGVLSNRTETPGTVKPSGLRTRDEWEDFELTLDYRLSKHANTGVFLRGRTEVQLAENVIGRAKPYTNGALYGIAGPLFPVKTPPNEWHSLYVRYEADRVTVQINGRTIHDNVRIDRVASAMALPGDAGDPGPIMLQDNTNQVWFRNIQIQLRGGEPIDLITEAADEPQTDVTVAETRILESADIELTAADFVYEPNMRRVFTAPNGQIAAIVDGQVTQDTGKFAKVTLHIDAGEGKMELYYRVTDDGLFEGMTPDTRYPQNYVPLPLRLGMEWQNGRFLVSGQIESNTPIPTTYKAEAIDVLNLPIGRVLALRVSHNTTRGDERTSRWYAPALGLVKFETARDKGQLLTYSLAKVDYWLPSPPERTVTFPNDRIVGKLGIRNWHGGGSWFGDRSLGDARGAVKVPPGKELGLVVAPDEPDLSFLDNLSPIDIQHLHIDGRNLTLDEARSIGRFTGLQYLSASESNFGDRHLAELSHLRGLHALKLMNTKVTDDSMEIIGANRTMRFLDLNGCNITGAGLARLAPLSHLEELFLSATSLDTGGIGPLARMPLLRHLNISYLKYSLQDDDIKNLSHARNLEKVFLTANPITDAGVKHLRFNQAINQLDIGLSQISDGSIDTILELRQLRSLDLRGTNITPAGAERLRKALPDCSINY